MELLTTEQALNELNIKDRRTLKKYIKENNINRVELSRKNIGYFKDDINKLKELKKK